MKSPEAAANKEMLAALLRSNLVGVRELRGASALTGKQAALRMRLRELAGGALRAHLRGPPCE